MDFNNDGVLDFLLGERDGYYNFYTGNGDGTLHALDYPEDNAGNPIERNYNSAGYLADWNEDGYIDFIAGGYMTESTSGGLLEVYLNTGDDITSPVWDANVIDLTSSVCNKWRITHQTYDLDRDGDKDMVMGYEMGNVWFAENIGTNADPQFSGYIQLTCDGGNIDVYNNYSGGGRARENVCDYNADGVPDLLVGCNNGVIYYFEGYDNSAVEDDASGVTLFSVSLSEVPTTGMFSVNVALPVAAPVNIDIYDASGRQITSQSTYCSAQTSSLGFDISANPAGMYLVNVTVNGTTVTERLVKIN